MFRLDQHDFFDKDKIINVLPRAPQEPFPEHCHSFHELVLVKSGCALHICDGSAMHVSKGSILYLREDDEHVFDQMDNLCLTNVLFRPEAFHYSSSLLSMLSDCCHQEGSGQIIVNYKAQQQADLLLSQIIDENNKRDQYSTVMVEALFSQLAITLWRAHQMNADVRSEEQDKLLMLINYINENYSDELNWNELSEHFEIPMRTLNRKVQEHTGLTPNNYLGRVRLCHASYLLSHTQNPVTDIAFSCGFNDSNYFSSKFHQAFDMTPLQYRKRYK